MKASALFGAGWEHDSVEVLWQDAGRAFPKLIHSNKVEKGGHFAAWEQPELFSQEVRAWLQITAQIVQGRARSEMGRRGSTSSLSRRATLVFTNCSAR
jgi:hypothetical protein